MANQGGRLTVTPLVSDTEEKCSFCKESTAIWNITCSPQFFELINAYACGVCKAHCEECTAHNLPEKSALDN